MSLVMSRNQLGNGWVEVATGDVTQTLDQYWFHGTPISPNPPGWRTSGFITADKLPVRSGSNYRRPVTWGAKVSAAWTARGTIWRRIILRRKAF